MAQIMYFVIDTSHPDFDIAVEQAELAQSQYARPNSKLSVIYNADGTKACVKVIGGSIEWYENSQWYNHSGIIDVYTNEDDTYKSQRELRAIRQTEEWTGEPDEEVDAIPEEYK